MSAILFVLLSVKKKEISEKEVTIQGSQSLLCFKPLSKEMIISLTEMDTRMLQILQPSLWSAPLISRVQFLEKCVCI